MNRNKKQERFLELRIQGETYETIALELNVSKQTLINWCKEKDIQEAINIAQTIRFQSILDRFKVSKKDNIEFYSELSRKARNEIIKINLSKINPIKLLEIELKCTKAINEISKGRIFGGDTILEDFDIKPSFFFDPKD